ncbi:MAG: hypothetical protein IKE01_06680 [Clostridia bacterium]|nr:hypothetical protein [Clostridia bacterium]
MTIIEKKSERKKKAIMMLVEDGEYSIPYAMMLAEELNDQGKLLDNDYEELMEWLENRLNPPTPEPEDEQSESTDDNVEEVVE